MPTFDFTSPEGKKYTVEGPAGATQEQAFQILQSQLSAESAKPSFGQMLKNEVMDSVPVQAGLGALRGAASIGATLMTPIDAAMGNTKSIGNPERRASIDAAMPEIGARPDSIAYGAGKLGAEVAGTAGVGGALAKGLTAVAPGATGLANALTSGGFKAGTSGGVTNLLTRAAGGALSGGAAAGLVNPEYAKTGAVVGGALPVVAQGLGATTRAVGSAIRGKPVSAEVQQLAARAKELGINIPADRLVDSKPLNAVASSLNYVPMSGRAATEEAMNSQLNKALSRTFGQDSSNVTQALRKAETVLGGEFERTLKNNVVKFDKQLFDEATEVFNRAERELGSDALKPIASQIDELINKGASGQIDGQAAYNIKKTLDRIGRSSGNEAWHATELKKVLMGALDRSLGPKEAAAFAKTRAQYGNMLDLEKLAKNGVEGEVSVARLANMKNINNPQMQELADIAAQFVKGREGQHGAAQRIFTGGAAASVAGATGGVGGLAALGGAMAGGRATNMLLNSNLARNAALGTTNPALENALAQALPATYRAAPVLSAR
ncbi:hypothetical protein [Polaromonas sp. YR568]|uniref:hypothetical protein n=1 Tax=Polaromonas sp. YR568 TaxID=1855301 RepID=UPI0031380B39